jgi:hypothetical protein
VSETIPAGNELYIHADQKIEEVRKAAEQLMLADMNLSHKMDGVMTEQRLLKERVEEGISKTVFKTFEAVQDIQKRFEAQAGDNRIRDHKIGRVENMVEWFYRGLIMVFVAGLLLAIWKYK